jgi:hypothetical protein
MLSYVLDHASTGSDDFGYVIGWNHDVEGVPGELLAKRLVVFFQPFDQFFDSFLNVFESALHRANGLK